MALFLAGAWGSAPARAQANLEALAGDSENPIEITADDGIEWQQEKKVYIARGNATAVREGTTLQADTLTAHYREVKGGGTDIWKLDADGHVRILNAEATTQADRGVYDVGKGILVLTGRDLRLQTGSDVITARDSLEFWQQKNMAVARGDALAVRADKKLSADVLTAYFRKSAEGKDEIDRVEAFGNVRVRTATETVTGKRGVYDVKAGIATLFGGVTIDRGENRLAGEYGEVNLNTGISRLLSAPGAVAGQDAAGTTEEKEGKKGRVRAIFSPKKKAIIENNDPEKNGKPAATP